jgi:electron transfer flavoprotein alpha subunit
MNGILVIAETAGPLVRRESWAALALGLALSRGDDDPLTVLVANPDAAVVAGLSVEGVGEIVHLVAEPDSALLATRAMQLVEEHGLRLVIAPHTVESAAYGARIAIEVHGGFAANVSTARDEADGITARRSIYGGRLDVELKLPSDRPAVLLVRGTADPLAPLASGVGASVTTEAVVPGEPAWSRRVGLEEAPSGEVDLAGARFVMGIGRGIADRESLPLFEAVAARMGATLGSSRPLVDAGWMPRHRQVGQSGASIAPAVYLAFGISGAAEHLAGISGAETVIAVNTDPRAAIFSRAAYGAVADATDVLEELARAWD